MPSQRRQASLGSLDYISNSVFMEVSGISHRDYVQMLMRMSAEHVKLVTNQRCDWSIASRVFKYAEEDDREWLAIVTALTSLPSGPFSHVFISCFIQYWLPVPPVSTDLIRLLTNHISACLNNGDCDHGPLNTCILLHALAYKYSGVISEFLLSQEILTDLLRILRDNSNRTLQLFSLSALEAFSKCNVNKRKILDAGIRPIIKGILISLDAGGNGTGDRPVPININKYKSTCSGSSSSLGHGCDSCSGSQSETNEECSATACMDDGEQCAQRYQAPSPESSKCKTFVEKNLRRHHSGVTKLSKRLLSNSYDPTACTEQQPATIPVTRSPTDIETSIRTRRYSLRYLLSKISRSGFTHGHAKKCSSCVTDDEPTNESYTCHQLYFCVTWALENSFFTLDGLCVPRLRSLKKRYILDYGESGRHVKLSSDGLEVRNDTHEFESVRGCMGVCTGCYYYETQVYGPFCFQIGWTTHSVKFYNGGDGVGDDIGSVGYDPVRQLLWCNRGDDKTAPAVASRQMKSGDTLGFFLELFEGAKFGRYLFALNGEEVVSLHSKFPVGPETSYYPAASFNYQHLRFNFGELPFKFEPPPHYEPINVCLDRGNFNYKLLDIPSTFTRCEDHEQILKGIGMSRSTTPNAVDECQICFGNAPNVTIMPCTHNNMCMDCVMRCTHCPMCREVIEDRVDQDTLCKFQEAA
eukprot:CFRG5663T1